MSRTLSILVVDDIPLMRTMLVKYVQSLGKKIFGSGKAAVELTISEAPNGRAALERLHEAPVDLIFLDLMMPEMDGLTFLHFKGQEPGIQRIPVIVCSAVGEDEIVQRARSLGASAYVTKPFKLASLETEVRDVIKREFKDVALS
jgi:CheY-like chemotaxis protein